MKKEKSNQSNDDLRKKAIEKLEQKKTKSEKQFSDLADNIKLIHELEIHQIELELQNEELKHAKDEAELAYRKFSDLYDFTLLGYFTLSLERNYRIPVRYFFF